MFTDYYGVQVIEDSDLEGIQYIPHVMLMPPIVQNIQPVSQAQIPRYSLEFILNICTVIVIILIFSAIFVISVIYAHESHDRAEISQAECLDVFYRGESRVIQGVTFICITRQCCTAQDTIQQCNCVIQGDQLITGKQYNIYGSCSIMCDTNSIDKSNPVALLIMLAVISATVLILCMAICLPRVLKMRNQYTTTR